MFTLFMLDRTVFRMGLPIVILFRNGWIKKEKRAAMRIKEYHNLFYFYNRDRTCFLSNFVGQKI